MEGYQQGGVGKNRGKGTGTKKYKWQIQNRQGEVKNSIGSGEAKEIICVTHGHELRGSGAGEKGVQGRGNKERVKWDNCNSIINKIQLK